MTENTVTSIDAERQEADANPAEIIRRNASEAIDTLYVCRSKIEVFIELFTLKDRGGAGSPYYGLIGFNEDLNEQIQDVINLIEEVEGVSRREVQHEA